MNEAQFIRIINYIVNNCVRLKNKYVSEKNLDIDYICVFSQDNNEFQKLLKRASYIGKIIQKTKTGPIIKITKKVKTKAGVPRFLKIRKPDATRPQRGDVDFNTNYSLFKSTYLSNRQFKLIKRQKFEMIELRDNKFDVLVYFSNIPPSKLSNN